MGWILLLYPLSIYLNNIENRNWIIHEQQQQQQQQLPKVF